jgi:hydrogenase maturation protease
VRTLVLGLGNPLRGDDAIGLRVAEEVRRRELPVDVDVDSGGGLRVMERLVGYDRAVLVDAMISGGAPGTVRRLDAEALRTQHTSSSHEVSLATALTLARRLGLSVPPQVPVVAVEIAPALEFREELSPEVQAALPAAVRAVEDECRRVLSGGP